MKFKMVSLFIEHLKLSGTRYLIPGSSLLAWAAAATDYVYSELVINTSIF